MGPLVGLMGGPGASFSKYSTGIQYPRGGLTLNLDPSDLHGRGLVVKARVSHQSSRIRVPTYVEGDEVELCLDLGAGTLACATNGVHVEILGGSYEWMVQLGELVNDPIPDLNCAARAVQLL